LEVPEGWVGSTYWFGVGSFSSWNAVTGEQIRSESADRVDLTALPTKHLKLLPNIEWKVYAVEIGKALHEIERIPHQDGFFALSPTAEA